MAYVSPDLERFLVDRKLYKCLSALYDIPEEKRSSISFAQKDGRLLSYIKPFENYNAESDPVYSSDFRAQHAIEIKPARLMPKSMDIKHKQDLSSALIARDAEINAEAFYEITKDISRWYLPENYANQTLGRNSMLHGSCMRYAHCQKTIETYERIPYCFLMIKRDGFSGRITARALLWYAFDVDAKRWRWIMDRIYHIDDNHGNALHQQAIKMGITSRDTAGRLTVPYIPNPLDYPPYTDTFRFYDPSSRSITNDDKEGNLPFHGGQNKECTLINVWGGSGRALLNGEDNCAICRTPTIKEDMLGPYCKGCGVIDHAGDVQRIDHCIEVGGKFYRKNDALLVYSDYMMRHYLADDCEFVREIGSSMHKDDLVKSKHHNRMLYRGLAVKVDDDYFPVSDIGSLIRFDEKSRAYVRQNQEVAAHE